MATAKKFSCDLVRSKIEPWHGRATVFHKPEDYESFLSLLSDEKACPPGKIFVSGSTSNHFQFVLENRLAKKALS